MSFKDKVTIYVRGGHDTTISHEVSRIEYVERGITVRFPNKTLQRFYPYESLYYVDHEVLP